MEGKNEFKQRPCNGTGSLTVDPVFSFVEDVDHGGQQAEDYDVEAEAERVVSRHGHRRIILRPGVAPLLPVLVERQHTHLHISPPSSTQNSQ